jgi:hypothetical protein
MHLTSCSNFGAGLYTLHTFQVREQMELYTFSNPHSGTPAANGLRCVCNQMNVHGKFLSKDDGGMERMGRRN